MSFLLAKPVLRLDNRHLTQLTPIFTYSYFPVHGSSLPELHMDMASHGPTANGVRGYGTTAASRGSKMSVAACHKNGGYHFDLEFLIKLPRVAKLGALSSGELSMWNRFARSEFQFGGAVLAEWHGA